MSERLQQLVHPQLQQYLTDSLHTKDFEVEPLAAGASRDNYLVTAEGIGKCVLHAKQGRATEQYAASIEFQMYLEQEGAPVAKTLAAPKFLDEALCWVQLCEFIRGRHLQTFSSEASYELGHQLGLVHQLSLKAAMEQRFNSELRAPGFDRAKRRARFVQTVRGYGSYLSCLMTSASRVPRAWIYDAFKRSKSDSLQFGQLPSGFTHGDLHPTNLIYALGDGNCRLLAFLDFEYVNLRPLVTDLVTCVVRVICADSTELKSAQANTAAFLAGYQSKRPLSQAELQALPLALEERLRAMLRRRLSRWHRLSEEDAGFVLANQFCLRELVHVIGNGSIL